MMMVIIASAILQRSRGERKEKREEQRKRKGERDLTVSSCLLFSTPGYFLLVQPEENLTVLQDKESKGKKRT